MHYEQFHKVKTVFSNQKGLSQPSESFVEPKKHDFSKIITLNEEFMGKKLSGKKAYLF